MPPENCVFSLTPGYSPPMEKMQSLPSLDSSTRASTRLPVSSLEMSRAWPFVDSPTMTRTINPDYVSSSHWATLCSAYTRYFMCDMFLASTAAAKLSANPHGHWISLPSPRQLWFWSGLSPNARLGMPSTPPSRSISAGQYQSACGKDLVGYYYARMILPILPNGWSRSYFTQQRL